MREKSIYNDILDKQFIMECYRGSKAHGLYVEPKDKFGTVTHQPVANLPVKWYNIHGHIHRGVHREFPLTNRHFNVSVEVMDYTPVHIYEILNKWRRK